MCLAVSVQSVLEVLVSGELELEPRVAEHLPLPRAVISPRLLLLAGLLSQPHVPPPPIWKTLGLWTGYQSGWGVGVIQTILMTLIIICLERQISDKLLRQWW